jgi:hypothetical protein
MSEKNDDDVRERREKSKNDSREVPTTMVTMTVVRLAMAWIFLGRGGGEKIDNGYIVKIEQCL